MKKRRIPKQKKIVVIHVAAIHVVYIQRAVAYYFVNQSKIAVMKLLVICFPFCSLFAIIVIHNQETFAKAVNIMTRIIIKIKNVFVTVIRQEENRFGVISFSQIKQ
jgi:hypothetical protein